MIVTVTLPFRGRRDPYDYDMTDQVDERTGRSGPKGTSYSFEVIDEDDSKVKVKCSKEVWESLGSVARGTPVTFTMAVYQMKVAPGQTVKAQPPAPARAA